jgi:peroxiredoxin
MKNWMILAFLAFGLTVTAQDGYNVGDVATDFNLENVDGEMISLKGTYPDAEGYIVIFTCNHCPYAVLYEDRIIDLHNKFARAGYPVIAINPNDPEVQPEDSFEGMQIRAEEKGFDFPYVFDEDQSIFPKYGAKKTPHVYILDSDLVVRYIGAIDDNPRDAAAVEEKYVEKAIGALKAGEEVNPNLTKAVGCSIKVKKS